jgi:hypothetical protein
MSIPRRLQACVRVSAPHMILKSLLSNLVDACRSRSIDPWAYITDVLTRLPTMKITQVREVLPDAWAKEQREKKRQMASTALVVTVTAS